MSPLYSGRCEYCGRSFKHFNIQFTQAITQRCLCGEYVQLLFDLTHDEPGEGAA